MMKKLTGLVTDPIYLEHKTGAHPENPDRLRHILKELQSSPIWDKLEIIGAEKAERSMIEMVHDRDYIDALKQKIESGVSFVGTMDCTVSSKTFEVAEHAVGGALKLTKKVSSGEIKNGFALIRPPGHHAERSMALGFCFFNNIAICAEYLIKHENYERILIVDFDVHHGNGTQHSFEDRKDIFYCSIHENPDVCYPGTGYKDEIGKEEGRGYTLNIPMPSYSGDTQYIEELEKNLIPAWKEYRPQFVLISAGYDAHQEDPLANINITKIAYKAYMDALCKIASEFCSDKLVVMLEGGYNLAIIPRMALLQIETLLKAAHNIA